MRVIFTTCSPDKAEELVLTLLRERLIGCGNLIPAVRSHYFWEGELCSDEEVVLLMESPADRAQEAIARLEQLHPYDVPKIVTLDPASCNPDYLQWLRSVTAPAG